MLYCELEGHKIDKALGNFNLVEGHEKKDYSEDAHYDDQIFAIRQQFARKLSVRWATLIEVRLHLGLAIGIGDLIESPDNQINGRCYDCPVAQPALYHGPLAGVILCRKLTHHEVTHLS